MISFRQILVGALWGLLAFTSVYLGVITFRYFSLRTDIGFLNAKQAFVHNTAWMTAFYIHISASICVVLAGPFQFLKRLRQKNIQLHRLLGKIYITAILLLAAPSGFYMALFANGGLGAQLGFSVLCVLWFSFTLLAYLRVRAGNITAHRQWMLRSYALSFSAVTLRLYTPILSLGFDLDDATVMAISAWINWVPNLLVAEIIIKRTVK
jgi:uncharacterized membrane protein